jgi:hypothetical protein
MDEEKKRDLIKGLADAVSTQSEATNRTWLALITAALFALIPHSISSPVSLPFSFGDVPQAWFHGIIFSLLVALAIAFASAHSQQVRAQKLAQSVIDSLGSSLGPSCDIHPRDYFDMLRKASLIHVASLAQSLRGEHQFYNNRNSLPKWRRSTSVVVYGVWKLIVFAIYFVLPVVAIWKAHQNFSTVGLLQTYNVIGTFIGCAALGQVLLLDVQYAAKILQHLWSSGRSQ